MKILMGSYCFSPDVGGIETASAILATEFAALGHEVCLTTQTDRSDERQWPFRLMRRPQPRLLFRAARWCDVFFQNNISLHSLWAVFVSQRPWVVTHQTWITRADGTLNWRDRLKRLLLPYATNIAISESIARNLGVDCHRIGNPYQPEIFKLIPGVQRNRQLVFLGRLVSDKGLDLLIKALAILRENALAPNLTVIGTGPEEPALRELAITCEVQDQVEFVGARTGKELAELLNAHEVLVVPSRWNEPFGIVALEGIACGCVVVGSGNGGLRESIGPCGLTFGNESVEDLANALQTVLSNAELRASLRSARADHLARFEAANIAREYLRVFEAVAR